MIAKFQFVMKLTNETVAVIASGRMRESGDLRDVLKKCPVGSGRDKTTWNQKGTRRPVLVTINFTA